MWLPKWKQHKRNKVGARSLTCNTYGVGRHKGSKMGLGQTHKQEFKMKSTCTTKEKGD
jgi:hypothetical protein